MTTGKSTDVALAMQMVAGVKKHFSNGSTLTFGSATFTPAQTEAFLQTLIGLRTAVDDAKSATKAKIVAEAAQAPPPRSQMAPVAPSPVASAPSQGTSAGTAPHTDRAAR